MVRGGDDWIGLTLGRSSPDHWDNPRTDRDAFIRVQTYTHPMSGPNGRTGSRLGRQSSEGLTGYTVGVVADTRAIVRSDERVLLVFLVLLSVVALAVFLHYTVSVLDGLPEVPPGLVSVSL